MKLSKYPKFVEYELHRYTNSESIIINAFVISRDSVEGYSGKEVVLPELNYSHEDLEIKATNETISKDEILLLTKDIVVFRGSVIRFPTDIEDILDKNIEYGETLADINYRDTVQRIKEDKKMKDKIQNVINSDLEERYQSIFVYLLRKKQIKNKLMYIEENVNNDIVSSKIKNIITECELDYK